MRLALKVNRIDWWNIQRELTPEQFEQWRAALDVVGIDDSWNQTGVICQEIHRVGFAAAGGKGDPPKPSDFHLNRVTFESSPVRKSSKFLTVDEMKAQSKRRAGL